MRRRWARFFAAFLPAVCVAAALVPPAHAAPPQTHPFYQPPSPLPPGNPGDLIRHEEITAYADPAKTLRLDAHSWRIMYHSTSATGERIAVTGSYFVPKGIYLGKRPLVAFAVGTKGLGDLCAPSWGLTLGQDYEGLAIKSYLEKGWAVVVTDYEKLGTPGDHTYMVGQSQGRVVLDALRAAVRFPRYGARPDAPMAVVGYSQGGASAGWAAQLHPSYAPELPVKGVAAGGTPADLDAVAKSLDGSPFFMFLAAAAVGLTSAYPELPFEEHLNEKGRELLEDGRDDCLAEAIPKGIGKRMSDFVDVDLLNTPAWQARLKENRLGGVAPAMPVLMYHSLIDEIIPFAQAKTLRAEWCGKGANLEWRQYLRGEHAALMYTALGPTQQWIEDRLKGRSTDGNC
ncbi:lipase family protein [Bailinhaonella thermotolerans]|uniref:Triacylglycerol lipase n=1 Tax=Bailinhaonella thermotolerans TaxID=1070861 RepID=A0A3A4A4F5_9ACTN|nr:lipase family protein [Bailinhaonella thermotolerans]RJL23646.1 triacylglycerol lipase [Bailinhaonella thermotolerans]